MNYLEKINFIVRKAILQENMNRKKYLLAQKAVIYLMNAVSNILICKCITVLQTSVIRTKHTVNV